MIEGKTTMKGFGSRQDKLPSLNATYHQIYFLQEKKE